MRRALVGRVVALEQRIELAPHDVHVDRRAGVLERVQADAQRALDKLRPIVRRTLRDERRQRAIREAQPVDDDRVALDADGQAIGGGVRP